MYCNIYREINKSGCRHFMGGMLFDTKEKAREFLNESLLDKGRYVKTINVKYIRLKLLHGQIKY